MAHHYSNSLYDRLADRLNQFPQGAPLSDSLFAILKILFSEKEAGLVAQLPIKPFTVDRAAAIWKLDKATAQNMLEDLAGRAMLLDMEQNGQQMFCLPPPMAGFFEFSMMRVRGDVNQKALAELYYQYLNVEEDFVKALFVENGTPLGRIFVQEAALPQDGTFLCSRQDDAAQGSVPAPDLHRGAPGGAENHCPLLPADNLDLSENSFASSSRRQDIFSRF